VRVLLRALEGRGCTQPAFVAQCAWALSHLACCEEGRVLIARRGGVSTLLQLCGKPGRDPAVLEHACAVLRSLACEPNIRLRFAEGRHSVLPLVRLCARCEAPKALHEAVWALSNLTFNSPENRRSLARARGVKALSLAAARLGDAAPGWLPRLIGSLEQIPVSRSARQMRQRIAVERQQRGALAALVMAVDSVSESDVGGQTAGGGERSPVPNAAVRAARARARRSRRVGGGGVQAGLGLLGSGGVPGGVPGVLAGRPASHRGEGGGSSLGLAPLPAVASGWREGSRNAPQLPPPASGGREAGVQAAVEGSAAATMLSMAAAVPRERPGPS
jgi:hypothetical protein